MNPITTKAVLAALNVGGWNARKRDEDASNVVHNHFHAEKDSGNYNKCLIDVKDDSWVRITKARSALRNFHYAQTLPWIHKGAQLLACKNYLAYNESVRAHITEYLDAADNFVERHYERLKTDAKKKRNGLYKEDDYPSKSELDRKFYAEVNFLPVPDAGHVVVDLVNEERDRIRRDTERQVEEAVAKAQGALWVRLLEPVKNMAEALSVPDKRFQDSLVENVREIVKLAPAMNLADDPQLGAMIDEVRKALTRTSAETLRTDPDKRAENARKAAALAAKMRSLMPVQP